MLVDVGDSKALLSSHVLTTEYLLVLLGLVVLRSCRTCSE